MNIKRHKHLLISSKIIEKDTLPTYVKEYAEPVGQIRFFKHIESYPSKGNIYIGSSNGSILRK